MHYTLPRYLHIYISSCPSWIMWVMNSRPGRMSPHAIGVHKRAVHQHAGIVPVPMQRRLSRRLVWKPVQWRRRVSAGHETVRVWMSEHSGELQVRLPAGVHAWQRRTNLPGHRRVQSKDAQLSSGMHEHTWELRVRLPQRVQEAGWTVCR